MSFDIKKILEKFRNLTKFSVLEKIYIVVVFAVALLFTGILIFSQIDKNSYVDKDTLELSSFLEETYTFTVEVSEGNYLFRQSLTNANIKSLKNFPADAKVTWYSTNIFNIETNENLLESNELMHITYDFTFKFIVPLAFLVFLLGLIGLFILRKPIKVLLIDKKVLLHFVIILVPYVLYYVICFKSDITYIDLTYEKARGLKAYLFKFMPFVFDFIWVSLFYSVIFFLSNKNKLISILSAILFIVYFFIANNAVLNFQNTVFNSNNFVNFYVSVYAILPIFQKILFVAFSLVFFGTLLYTLIKLTWIIFKTFSKAKCIVLLACGIFMVGFNFINIVTVPFWAVDLKETAQSYGIILTKNFEINYTRKNSVKIKKEDVSEAINLILDQKEKRDISFLLLDSTKNSRNNNNAIPERNIYLIFLESFYDYSDFISLFDKDPFPVEYREWSENSNKIAPNRGGGSFYARLAGLTGSSMLYPTTTDTNYLGFLPDLFSKNGYTTIALEEAGVTYNLDNVLSALQFDQITFNIGNDKLGNFIKEKILPREESKFVYAFTYLGHTGSATSESYEIAENESEKIKPFLAYFQNTKKGEDSIYENLLTSIQTAYNIIELRDAILAENPNAIIMFKHDHLYPLLTNGIQESSMDEVMKQNFLDEVFPSPFLVWDGQYGAFEVPKGFVPENIPLFIAINAGLDYENTPIDLLYKDSVQGQVSSYHEYYDMKTEPPTHIMQKEQVAEELLKLENAINIVSHDIFAGKSYTYEIMGMQK